MRAHKKMSLIMVLAFMVSMLGGMALAAEVTTGEDAGISILLDGAKVKSDAAYPYFQNGRTMVPLRVISEDLGAHVEWDPTTYTITITQADNTIQLTIGNATVYVNGSAVELDAAAELFNDRTMVPVRFVAEALGCTVTWYEEGKTVIIQSQTQPEAEI